MEIRSRHRNAGTVDVVFRRTPAFRAKLVKTPGIYRFWVDFRGGTTQHHHELLLLLFFVVVATVVVQLLSVVVVACSCCMSEFCSKAKLLPLKKIDRKNDSQAGRQSAKQPLPAQTLCSHTHTHQPHLHTRRTRRIKRRFVVNKLCCLLSGASVAKAKLRQVLPFLHSQKEKGKKKIGTAHLAKCLETPPPPDVWVFLTS